VNPARHARSTTESIFEANRRAKRNGRLTLCFRSRYDASATNVACEARFQWSFIAPLLRCVRVRTPFGSTQGVFPMRLLILLFAMLVGRAGISADRPNILWVTSEDNGPHLGCYGDDYADTPHIDRLAERGTAYRHAWSNAPVCAPARTTLITGMYPPSLGAQHMRSAVRIPEEFSLYPTLLRQAGYYCTNNSKTDYNLAGNPNPWHESSGKAHWRNRDPDQPFFAIFNFTISHESQIRKRPHQPVHDPAQVRVPAYHPDTPEVRRDWAQYYDKVTEMDRQVGQILGQLDEDGLTDETIIFYYGDHGSGMPRSKRWPYDSGLLVPLIVVFPEKYRHLAAADYQPGGFSDRLVSFVDLAPTAISLAGVEPPSQMQGRAFHGAFEAAPREYLFGFRGRMDERIDMVRTIRDKRFIYLRHFMPHRRYGEHVDYMFQTPTTQVWHRLFHEGRLNEAQSRFWQVKPSEELYDLDADPDEVQNLAESPAHQRVLGRLRAELDEFLLSTRDTGFLPEAMMHDRAGEDTVHAMAQDPRRYDLSAILEVAHRATRRDPENLPRLLSTLAHDDPAIRYWSVVGLIVQGEDAVKRSEIELGPLLDDPSPSVRIVAAEALGRFAADAAGQASVAMLLDLANVETHGPFVSTQALNSLDALPPERLAGLGAAIRELPTKHESLASRLRMGAVTENLVKHLLTKTE
jgi:arylsulfatase A-like enzyme